MLAENVFKEVRADEISRIMQKFPLACIVTNTPDGLYATHIPLMSNGENILFGHVAIANELYTNVAEDQEVLCIFKGDDAYISANYYPSKFDDHKKVPTWNYQVVHVHGKIKFLTDQKNKLAALGRLTRQNEERVNGASAWKMSDAPKDYLMMMLDQLVVFEIHVSRILAKSKLSQNREKHDFDGVIKALQMREEDGVANSMLGLNRQ